MAKLGPVLPPQQIAKILRTHGFVPQATPVRNGEAYQVRALDRMGRQVRVAVDARYGDILVVRPIAMAPAGAYAPYGPPPYYYGGAYPPSPRVRPLPPDQSAALTPVHPPLPRPKPAAKPAAVAPAPAAAPEASPPAAAPATAPPAAEAPAAAPAPPVAAPPPPATASPIPPVAPLE
jgi:hypothetical protein